MDMSMIINSKNKPVPVAFTEAQRPSPLRPPYTNVNSTLIVASDVTKDGVVYGSAGNNIRKSYDFGVTATTLVTIPGTITPTIAWVQKMDDGSVVAAIVNRDLDIGEIWRSDINEANFAKVYTFLTPKSKPSATFGYSKFKNILLVNEYGTDKSLPNNPRRGYMSVDYGATWKQIFEAWNVDGVHPHDIQYDPYEDIIWVVTGDGVANRLVWYSVDRGVSWKTIIPQVQFTNISVLPNCILFGTDTALIVGFYRLDRPKSGLRTATNLQIVEAYIQTRNHPQMPIASKSYSDFDNGVVYSAFYETMPYITVPSTIYATKDGINFYVIWQSKELPSASSDGVGVLAIAGITSDGNLVAYVRSLVPGGSTTINTLRLSTPKWVGVLEESSGDVKKRNKFVKWFGETIADSAQKYTYYGKTKGDSGQKFIPFDISDTSNKAIYLKNNGSTPLNYYILLYDINESILVSSHIFKTAVKTLAAGAEILLNATADVTLAYPFVGMAVSAAASTPTGTLNLMILKEGSDA